MIRLASDQNFNHDILRGLLRRLPNLDVRSIQDAGLSEADDPTVLEWAAAEGRILLTHDRSTMPDYANERVRTGRRMPGVLLVNDRASVGQVINDLYLIAACYRDDDWKDTVQHIPL